MYKGDRRFVIMGCVSALTILISVFLTSLAPAVQVSSSVTEAKPFSGNDCFPATFVDYPPEFFNDWEQESRTDDNGIDYYLFHPGYSSTALTLFYRNNFDSTLQRTEYYRDAFITAILQPGLSARRAADLNAQISQIAELASSATGLGGNAVSLLNALTSNGSVDLGQLDLPKGISEWASKLQQGAFKDQLTNLSTALKGLSISAKLASGTLRHLFLHSLANARALDNIAILDQLLINSPPELPMQQGYQQAKALVEEFIREDYDFIRASLDEIEDGLGDYLIVETELAIALAVHYQALSPAISGVAGGVFLFVHVLVDIGADVNELRLASAEAAVETWLTGAIQEFDWPASKDEQCTQLRPLLGSALIMRCALSFEVNKRFYDVLAFELRPYDIIRYFITWLISRFGGSDLETARWWLNGQMDVSASWPPWYEERLLAPALSHPAIVSHSVTPMLPPRLEFAFDRDMDESSFGDCVRVQASQSGDHAATVSFDHDLLVLSLDPTGEFQGGESVTVILDTCVKSLDGLGLLDSYTVTLLLEPEPKLLIATWAGRNGSVTPDTLVSAGSNVTVTGIPSPGYEIATWYLDGQPVPDNGSEYELSNVTISHSVGVTFRPSTAGEVTVTAPDGGEVFGRRSKMPITWSWKGEVGSTVNIDLLKAGEINRTVATGLFNDGSYLWSVPIDVQLGSDFNIRISAAAHPDVSGKSPGSFQIVESVVVPSRIAIWSISDLQAIGSDAAHPDTGYYVLMTDLNASGVSFQPIGTGPSNYFDGTLDGNGHTIRRLDMELGSSQLVGLFSVLDNRAVIKNLTLIDPEIEGGRYVGAIAGRSKGSIVNCYLKSETQEAVVRGSLYTGGFVGDNLGIVRNCVIERSGLHDFLVRSDTSYVGGVVGVNGQGSVSVATVEFCIASCYVEGRDDYTGGVAGWNFDIIRECSYNGTQVDGRDWGNGGIVGWNAGGSILNSCFRGGNLDGATFVGGIAGWFEGGNIDSCFAAGPISTSASVKGGVAGRCGGTISECFWDIDLTGCANPNVDGNCSVSNSHGVSTVAMANCSTFTSVHGTWWDIGNVWSCASGEYPRLRGAGLAIASPQNATATTNQPDGVHVSWDAVYYSPERESAPLLTAMYRVLRADSSHELAARPAITGWIESPQFIDTTALPDELYYYWIVSAATNKGARESQLAGPVGGMRVHPPVPSPLNVTSSESFVNSVLVEWDAADANYYQVYRTPAAALRSGLRGAALLSASTGITGWQKSMKLVDIPPSAGEQYVYSVASSLDSLGTAACLETASDTGSAASADVKGPDALLTVNPTKPLWSQSVEAIVSVHDDHGLSRVVLHWAAELEDSMYWAVSASNEFGITYAIGSFQAGDTLRIWTAAVDASGNASQSDHVTVIVSDESIAPPMRPEGDAFLLPGVSIVFATDSAASALGDPVDYRFDWGDSSLSPWGSGSDSKSWSEDGLYLVKAQARSQTNPTYESPWSDPLPVWVDSRSPILSILSNDGEDMEVDSDTAVVWGDAMEQLPGSGIDSVWSSVGVPNEGNESSWGFLVPLDSNGQSVDVEVFACDRAGNVGSASIRVTRADCAAITNPDAPEVSDPGPCSGANYSVFWQPVTGAASYALYEVSIPEMDTTLVYVGESLAFDTAHAFGSYVYVVMAKSGCQAESLMSAAGGYVSILNVSPPSPLSLEPGDGLSGPSERTFSWSPNDPCAVKYQVRFHTSTPDTCGNAPYWKDTVVSEDSVRITGIPGAIWWCVRSIRGVDTSLWVGPNLYTDVGEDNGQVIPRGFELSQNRPNPFNAGTVIEYALSTYGSVRLEVFDILGRRIAVLADSEQDAGPHAVIWDGTDMRGRHVASGLYFYRIVTEENSVTRKMVLLK